MTLLHVIDWDKISTVNSMSENKFFQPWAKMGVVWFGICDKIKIKKNVNNTKRKIIKCYGS